MVVIDLTGELTRIVVISLIALSCLFSAWVCSSVGFLLM